MEGLLHLLANSTTLSSSSVQHCHILFTHLVRLTIVLVAQSPSCPNMGPSVTIPPSREASGSVLYFKPWLIALSTLLYDPYYLILVNWLNWGRGYHAGSAKQYQKYPGHQKERQGSCPFLSLSCVEMRARDRIPCAWRLGLWPCGHSPHTALTAGKHRLVTGFRHPFPTSSPKNHASQLPEHKHNEQNDLLPKDHKSLNKLPSQQQKPLSFGLKLTFQLFPTTEMPLGWCSALSSSFRSSALWARWKETSYRSMWIFQTKEKI